MHRPLLLIVTILLLSACETTKDSGGLTPFPEPTDPKDTLLFEAITSYIQKQNAPPNSVYDFVRVDLNGDNMREGIVLFKLPHTHWCGWDGCGMAIFRAHKEKFTPLSSMSGVRGPIYVSTTENQGWRDIIIRISGTNLRDKNVIMRFDGQGYPNSPMLAQTLAQRLSALQTDIFFR